MVENDLEGQSALIASCPIWLGQMILKILNVEAITIPSKTSSLRHFVVNKPRCFVRVK